MVDKDGYMKKFSEEDIDYSLVYTPYYDQLKARYAPYGLCAYCFYESGISVVRWGVGELDKFGCPTKYIDAYIDTDFRIIEPFQMTPAPFNNILLEWVENHKYRKQNKPSIW